ncbi:MAG: hypothetical protein ACJ79K_04900 [Gemmatimonadaceae bacterium]
MLLMLLGLAFVAPLVVGLTGTARDGRRINESARRPTAWDWRLSIGSTLLYAIAFNLVFLVQEICLVLPKALTPGLHPTLYHNNHNWTGENPIARLLQGSGALAILVVGVLAIGVLAHRPPRGLTTRLLVIWIGFNGLFQSLPQVVAGAIVPRNDVGMAMDYLHLGWIAMITTALAALVAMAVAGTWLAPQLVEVASNRVQLASYAQRMTVGLRVATLPAIAAIPVILLFRIPGPVDQVVMVPIAVTLIGVAWVQGTAWRAPNSPPRPARGRVAIRTPLALLLVLLAIFQLMLRPGVSFG